MRRGSSDVIGFELRVPRQFWPRHGESEGGGCSLDKGPALNTPTSLSSAQEKAPVCLEPHLPEGPQLTG